MMSLAVLFIMLGLTGVTSSTPDEDDSIDTSVLLQGRAQVKVKPDSAGGVDYDYAGDYAGEEWDYAGDGGGDEWSCEELRALKGEDYDDGPCAPVRDDSWAENVPAGKNPIPKAMLGQECQSSPGNQLCDSLGTCDKCGLGNACCRFNDAGLNETNHPECCLATASAFLDNRKELHSLATRCVFPTSMGADKKCNYQNWKDEIWNSMADALSGGGQTQQTPSEKSPHPAPTVEAIGYDKKPGKADADHYLLIGLDSGVDSATWKEKCPAYGDPKYTLNADESNGGLFNMTYYHHPTKTSTFPINIFCGALYTNEVSQEKVNAAAEMAKTACDDMGDLCGGFTVGTDPECCGPKPPKGEKEVGCTEVAFLTSKARLSGLKLNLNPCSSKTCKYGCNYATFTKA